MLLLRWVIAVALIAAICVALWKFARADRDRNRLREGARRYASHPSAVIGLALLIALYAVSLLAPCSPRTTRSRSSPRR